MNLHHLNWLAILVAAISTMIVGFLWYSPFLFAKPWMREMGYDPNDKAKTQEMQKSAGRAYAGSFVASLREAKHETLRHQHRLPARLLPRHGRHHHRLAVAD
jgi:Protein of unknown function (DUF1761)